MPNTVEMGKVLAIDSGNRGIGLERLCEGETRLHSCVEGMAGKRGEMCICNCGVTMYLPSMLCYAEANCDVVGEGI